MLQYSLLYAGLYLGKWEEDFVLNQENNKYHKFIIWWGRYIDDVLSIWSALKVELKDYSYLNCKNPNIKLSLEYSRECINFLDLTILKFDQGFLHASVYRKPTDRNTILNARSFHPNRLKENVPYGHFQGVKRICDQENVFETISEEIMSRFRERRYRNSTLQRAYTRAKHVDRASLLQRQIKDR